MTQPGETDDLSLDEHLRVLREHTGHDLFDCILVNGIAATPAQLARYRSEGAELIEYDGNLPAAAAAQVAAVDLLDTSSDKMRHDSRKLAAAIIEIVRRGRPSRPALEQSAWFS